MKLFKKIKIFFGYSYRVNLNSMEIHNLKNTHKNCKLEKMNNFKDITESNMLKHLKNGYNGCRWCSPSTNTDRR
jgi:hypothetical protein